MIQVIVDTDKEAVWADTIIKSGCQNISKESIKELNDLSIDLNCEVTFRKSDNYEELLHKEQSDNT